MPANRPEDLLVGRPDYWKPFAERRAVLLERLPRLVALANKVYNRTAPDTTPNDRLILGFGVIVWEDFDDILILCANGRGFGGQKILRGMFERVVTTSHLHRHPEDTDRFLDFHYVSDYKLANEIFTSIGEYAGLTKELLAEKKAARDRVKDKFTRTCPTPDCGKTIPAFSWTNVDVVAMAKADKDLKDLVGIAYYVPMSHSHATLQSLISHMDGDDPSGGLGKSEEKSLSWADRVICAAHNLTLKMLVIQLEHFSYLKESLGGELQKCIDDFSACWKSDGDEAMMPPANL